MPDDTDQLPAPLVPREVDLRNFPDLPIEVARVRDSDLRRRSTGDEFKAALLLWFAAWHQVPAGSLPDDDIELADFAGMGTGKPAVRAFQKLKAMALRGWIRCAGHTPEDAPRLYHPRMAEKAVMAWKAKLAQRDRTLKARIASLAKMIEKETNPAKRAPWQAEHDRLLGELSDLQPHALSPHPVTGHPAGSKGSEGIGSDRKGGGSARDAREAPPPPGDGIAPAGQHLVETLASVGAATTPDALAEWLALVTGPLVRAASEDEQRDALRWMVSQQVNLGGPARYVRDVQAWATRWREHRAARQAAGGYAARAPEKSAAEYAEEHRLRRLAGRLSDWERNAIAEGRNHVGPAGEWLKGPTPADPQPAGQEPAA